MYFSNNSTQCHQCKQKKKHTDEQNTPITVHPFYFTEFKFFDVMEQVIFYSDL